MSDVIFMRYYKISSATETTAEMPHVKFPLYSDVVVPDYINDKTYGLFETDQELASSQSESVSI